MIGFLPAVMQDLGMGTYVVPTVGKAFVSLSGNTVAVAVPPQSADDMVRNNVAARLDKTSGQDVAHAGYARSSVVVLKLAASTPATVDLLAADAVGAVAGDRVYTSVGLLTFVNLGPNPVTVTPGVSNGFSGPIGTSFTVDGYSDHRMNKPAGWPVSPTARNVKFDPGSLPAVIAFAVAGTY